MKMRRDFWIHTAALVSIPFLFSLLVAATAPFMFGTSVGLASVNASLFAGADMCAKISAAATAMNGVNAFGGIIDAEGFSGDQVCAGNMFASWPGGGFGATVVLGAVRIVTQVPQVIPTRTRLRGYPAPYNDTPTSGQEWGTSIQACDATKCSAAFPSATATVTISNATPAVISWTAHGLAANQGVFFTTTGTLPAPLIPNAEYYVISAGLTANACEVSTSVGGAAVNTTNAGSGTHTGTTMTPVVALGSSNPAYTIELNHIAIDCTTPSTTVAVNGGIGVQNLYSQEQTVVDHVNIRGCYTGLQIAHAMGDTNRYQMLTINDTSHITGNSYHCIQIGTPGETDSSENNFVSYIDGVSCGANNSTPTTMVLVDGVAIGLRNIYLENQSGTATNCVLIGSQTGNGLHTRNVHIDNLVCDGSVAVTNGVQINSGVTGPVQLTNISGGSTNVILDNLAGGCTVLRSTTSVVGIYARGDQNYGGSNAAKLITDASSCMGVAPTISSGFGTSPSVVAGSNSPAAFVVNVGTGGTATSGVVGLTPAATTGWACHAVDLTTHTTAVAQTVQTASSTTTATFTQYSDVMVATAWAASDKLSISCFPY